MKITDHKYCLITAGNGYSFGFCDIGMAGAEAKNAYTKSQNKQLVFINYDHKSVIKNSCAVLVNAPTQTCGKQNNNLSFPEILFVECEREFLMTDLKRSEVVSGDKIKVRATVSKQEYIKNVTLLKQHIQQGDIYEINYCITFEALTINIDPVALYQKLNSISNASFSALAKFNNQYIISSSPELFLSRRGNKLITKPIKGTARRSSFPEEDLKIKTDLQSSLKERTENVMIVDVCRNDLSRIATIGSVKVEKLYDIESYLQVHQMVSTVSCELKEDVTFSEIIDATFPMASMTGAPKIRAMELIDQYELYNRGPYSGCLGYINPNGDFDLSVLIRSVFYDEEKQYLSFTVGSAITHLCDPEQEYEECLLKANAMLTALNAEIIN